MILKGEKVILRPIKLSDTPRFVEWLADSKVNQYTTRKRITLKEEKKWIKSLARKKDEIHWAIDTKDNIHIGSVGLEIRRQDKKADFDILIGDKSYWGKGYGFDVACLVMNYAFRKLRLHRVYLNVYSYNKRAIGLYKNLGFKVEGIGRESVYYKNKFYDQFYMGILRKEWRKIKMEINR